MVLLYDLVIFGSVGKDVERNWEGGVKIGGCQGFGKDLKPLLQNDKCLSQLQSGNTK